LMALNVSPCSHRGLVLFSHREHRGHREKRIRN
jgi:hypothetical protein